MLHPPDEADETRCSGPTAFASFMLDEPFKRFRVFQVGRGAVHVPHALIHATLVRIHISDEEQSNERLCYS